MNDELLSVTTFRGRPCVAKMLQSCSVDVVMEDMIQASIHLEWLSTTTRSMWFMNGPKKSR